MERVLYNIHSQLCVSALQKTSSKTRRRLEHAVLLAGVCGFSVLFVTHVSFVYRQGVRSIPNSCLESIPNFDKQADVIHVLLLEEQEESYATTLTKESCLSNATSIYYSFSKTRGFLLLPIETLQKHNISTQLVGVSKTNTQCFGEPFLQRIVFGVVGPDTVVVNWLSVLGDGLLYNPRTHVMQESFQTSHLSLWRTPNVSGRILVDKAGVVVTSIFLFFITTTLTSFTLRETQQRMLEFTIQLQNHVREDRSLGKLIFMHVLENLVFVPIMVGMMFFLIEFYGGDKVLAFMIQSVVWICEVFSVVSLRSQEGLRFFPRIFFLLFLVFHVYLFSCPHGFSYTALASTVAFLLHSMLFFWNRYELAAVAHGLVTLEHPRMDSERSPDRPLIPRLDTARDEPLTLAPRAPQRELSTQSISTAGRSGDLSRSPSGLFQHDTDEEDSCLYMLSGEVVYQRHARPSSPFSVSGGNEMPRRRSTSTSEDQIPLEVETSSLLLALDLTPRAGSSRNSEGRGSRPEIAFPF
jgi:Tumour-associated protein